MALIKLSIGHVLLILLSNVLVQYPFTVLGVHSTWGAITYPLIFILSDMTARLWGVVIARKVVFFSMIPGLILSYFVTCYFTNDIDTFFLGLSAMPLRIACACFIAYAVGQMLDITFFQIFRRNSNWWLAPIIASAVGNLTDTILFFSIAFYQCSDNFLSTHWPEIALVDMMFKMFISIFAFVPLYGVLLANVKKISV